MSGNDRLVTSGAFADAFGVTMKTIHHWERKGAIPKAQRNPGGGHRRWKASEAAKVLRAHGREVPAGWESEAP